MANLTDDEKEFLFSMQDSINWMVGEIAKIEMLSLKILNLLDKRVMSIEDQNETIRCAVEEIRDL